MPRQFHLVAMALAVAFTAAGCKDSEQTPPEQPTQTAAPKPKVVDYTADGVGQVEAGFGKPADSRGSWQQFRGPNRDNKADGAGLILDWADDAGPAELWRLEGLVDGHGGPAIHAGKVYFHDYDTDSNQWQIRCVSLADGRDIWTWSYQRRIRRNHGITRTVPVVDDRYVVSLDPKLVLHGLDAATGRRLWARDLVAEFGAVIPPWFNGQCPLDAGDSVIVGVGGDDILMAAFDKATGKTAWTTPNPHKLPMTHSSVMPMDLPGGRQFVWCTLTGIVGVDAAGRALWTHLWADDAAAGNWRPKVAEAPSPVQLAPDAILQTAGYQAGSCLLRVQAGQPLGTSVAWTRTAEQFSSEAHTPVVNAGHAFFVHGEGPMVCTDADGQIVWRGPEDVEFGLGPFMQAGDKFLLLTGKTAKTPAGWLYVAEASSDGWKQLAKARVIDTEEAWAPMALADGRLIVRGLHEMVCLDLAGQGR